MAPANIKTVHQTCLLHIESSLDRLGLLSRIHDQTNYAPTSFSQQVQVSQGHTLYRNKEKGNTEVHGGGGLELVKTAREPASSRPKPCASPKKSHESCPFAAPCGPRRKKNDRDRTSAFPSETSRFKPVILAHRGSAPPLARRRSSFPPPSPNLVRTHPIENYQPLRDSAPCLPRAATLPKGTKLELGRGAHLGTPSPANRTVAASQPTGRIAEAANWLHLSRVSPALHPPERPFHTHTPKPGFGGRGHVIRVSFSIKC